MLLCCGGVGGGTWIGYPSSWGCRWNGLEVWWCIVWMRFGGVFAAVRCVESGCGSCGVLCGRAGVGRRGTLWVRCHFRMVLARRLAVRDVRFVVKCGVDLDSPGKRGLDCSEGRRGVLSSAQGLVEDRVEGGCDVLRRGRYGCSWGWLLRLYPSRLLSLVGGGGSCVGACDLG